MYDKYLLDNVGECPTTNLFYFKESIFDSGVGQGSSPN